jgi:hypothetical protein
MRELRCRIPGFLGVRDKLSVEAGQTVAVRLVRVEESPGSIEQDAG